MYTDINSSGIQISYTVPWAGLLIMHCSTQSPASSDVDRDWDSLMKNSYLRKDQRTL